MEPTNRIIEEIEEEFIEILEHGKNLTGEEVWTDSEKMQWLRKKIDELLKSQREVYKDALIWCSGIEDFQIEGKAREGWEKICLPLIKE